MRWEGKLERCHFPKHLDHYDLIRIDEKIAFNGLWRGRSVGEVRVWRSGR